MDTSSSKNSSSGAKRKRSNSETLTEQEGSNAGNTAIDDNVQQQQQQQSSSSSVQAAVQPHDNDCLLGRGAPNVKNEGNVRYRKLIADRLPDYIAASANHEVKTEIAQSIIDKIHSRGGRFLKRDKDGNYVEVADSCVILEKTKQVFRDMMKKKRGADNKSRSSSRRNSGSDVGAGEDSTTTSRPISGVTDEELRLQATLLQTRVLQNALNERNEQLQQQREANARLSQLTQVLAATQQQQQQQSAAAAAASIVAAAAVSQNFGNVLQSGDASMIQNALLLRLAIPDTSRIDQLANLLQAQQPTSALSMTTAGQAQQLATSQQALGGLFEQSRQIIVSDQSQGAAAKQTNKTESNNTTGTTTGVVSRRSSSDAATSELQANLKSVEVAETGAKEVSRIDSNSGGGATDSDSAVAGAASMPSPEDSSSYSSSTQSSPDSTPVKSSGRKSPSDQLAENLDRGQQPEPERDKANLLSDLPSQSTTTQIEPSNQQLSVLLEQRSTDHNANANLLSAILQQPNSESTISQINPIDQISSLLQQQQQQPTTTTQNPVDVNLLSAILQPNTQLTGRINPTDQISALLQQQQSASTTQRQTAETNLLSAILQRPNSRSSGPINPTDQVSASFQQQQSHQQQGVAQAGTGQHADASNLVAALLEQHQPGLNDPNPLGTTVSAISALLEQQRQEEMIRQVLLLNANTILNGSSGSSVPTPVGAASIPQQQQQQQQQVEAQQQREEETTNKNNNVLPDNGEINTTNDSKESKKPPKKRRMS